MNWMVGTYSKLSVKVKRIAVEAKALDDRRQRRSKSKNWIRLIEDLRIVGLDRMRKLNLTTKEKGPPWSATTFLLLVEYSKGNLSRMKIN